nr:acetylajmalan esterase-like [Ipomoea batatas]
MLQFVNSIFQFGDSLSDTGNLIASGLGMQFDAGSLPYGENFFFHEATGRFSDGRLAYLNTGANFTQGVNFAVAGATALDEDFFTGKGISFKTFKPPISTQLEWFNKYLDSTCRKTADGSQPALAPQPTPTISGDVSWITNNLANSHYNLLNDDVSSLNTEFSGTAKFKLVVDMAGTITTTTTNCVDPTALRFCPVPERALHWDGVHLTDKTYGLVASYLVQNALNKLG